MWWLHQHSTQSTLLLSDHSISSTENLKCQPVAWYHVVTPSTQYTVNPPTVWPFNILWFWLMDWLCEPAILSCGESIYTVHKVLLWLVMPPDTVHKPCSYMVSNDWSSRWLMALRVGELINLNMHPLQETSIDTLNINTMWIWDIIDKQAWNYTKVMGRDAPGLGLGAPSKVSHRL